MVKYFYHLRHSMRVDLSDNSSFLSQSGVDKAKVVGSYFRKNGVSFNYVVSSTLNRAIQTPIAMGFAVNETTDSVFFPPNLERKLSEDIEKQRFSWYGDFQQFSNYHFSSEINRDYGLSQIALYQEFLDKIEDEETLLLVTHGGIIEFPLLEMFSEEDHSNWGHTFRYCEGYRVSFDGEKFTDLQFVRP